MVPFFACFCGVIYDVDLFDSKRFYFKSDNTIGAKLSDENLGTGPDGVSGTYDDGLPRTYDEFFALCSHMKNYAITPMICSGQYIQAYRFVKQKRGLTIDFSSALDYETKYPVKVPQGILSRKPRDSRVVR